MVVTPFFPDEPDHLSCSSVVDAGKVHHAIFIPKGGVRAAKSCEHHLHSQRYEHPVEYYLRIDDAKVEPRITFGRILKYDPYGFPRDRDFYISHQFLREDVREYLWKSTISYA